MSTRAPADHPHKSDTPTPPPSSPDQPDAIVPQRGQLGLARGTAEAGEGTGHRSDVTEEQIATRAREIWEAKGRPEGTAEADWSQAERELCGEAPC